MAQCCCGKLISSLVPQFIKSDLLYHDLLDCDLSTQTNSLRYIFEISLMSNP